MRVLMRAAVGIALASFVILAALLPLSGCSGNEDEPKTAESPSTAGPAGSDAAGDEPLPAPPYESALPEAVRAEVNKPFTGDLDEMVKRRLVRMGVTYSRTLYFVDQGVQRGVA